MCVCVCVNIYIYIHTHPHTYTHTHISVHLAGHVFRGSFVGTAVLNRDRGPQISTKTNIQGLIFTLRLDIIKVLFIHQLMH